MPGPGLAMALDTATLRTQHEEPEMKMTTQRRSPFTHWIALILLTVVAAAPAAAGDRPDNGGIAIPVEFGSLQIRRRAPNAATRVARATMASTGPGWKAVWDHRPTRGTIQRATNCSFSSRMIPPPSPLASQFSYLPVSLLYLLARS